MPESFNSDAYGPAVAKLLREDRIAGLYPGTPAESMRGMLKALTVTDIFQGKSIQNDYMANACLAALWLYFDFLNETHSISQTIPSTTGSLLHGIMHRRETDYSNAKYWFRKVITHPIYDPLQKTAFELASTIEKAPEQFSSPLKVWDPFLFTDLCEEHCGKDSPVETLCKQIQRREWELLFDYSYSHAMG